MSPSINQTKARQNATQKIQPEPLLSILIDDSQTTSRVEKHPNERWLLTSQQVFRRAPPPLRRISTSTSTRNTTLGIRSAAGITTDPTTPAIAPALRTCLAGALLRRQQAYYGRNFLAAGLALRHFHVSFVEAKLFAVDKGAEEEVTD